MLAMSRRKRRDVAQRQTGGSQAPSRCTPATPSRSARACSASASGTRKRSRGDQRVRSKVRDPCLYVINCPHCKNAHADGRRLGRQAVSLPVLQNAVRGSPLGAVAAAPVGAGAGMKASASRPGRPSRPSPPASAPSASVPPPQSRPSPSSASACRTDGLSGLRNQAARRRRHLHGLRLPDPGGQRGRRAEGRAEPVHQPRLRRRQSARRTQLPALRQRRCRPPPGTMLHGRYRIDKLLAMGGFGAVYLADRHQGEQPRQSPSRT